MREVTTFFVTMVVLGKAQDLEESLSLWVYNWVEF